MSDETPGTPIIRSLIAGGMGLAGTLIGLGATGLLTDLNTGALACLISFFFGFIMRMGVEYGISVPPDD